MNLSGLSNEELTTPVFGVPADLARRMETINPPTASRFLPGSTAKYEEQDKKHKGAAGVFRDIFGTLGDLLLSRVGLKPMYGPSQEKRKMALAQQGFGQDPQSTADAISRVSSLDPALALKMRDQYTDNARLEAQVNDTAENRAARLQLLQDARDQKIRSTAIGILSTSLDPSHTDADRVATVRKYKDYLTRLGVEDVSNLDETSSLDDIKTAIGSAIAPGMQAQQALTRTSIENKDKQATASLEERKRHNLSTEEIARLRTAISAQRASSGGGGSRPRKPTEGDIIESYIDSGKPLTQGQKTRINKYMGKYGSSGSYAPPSSTPPGWSVK